PAVPPPVLRRRTRTPPPPRAPGPPRTDTAAARTPGPQRADPRRPPASGGRRRPAARRSESAPRWPATRPGPAGVCAPAALGQRRQARGDRRPDAAGLHTGQVLARGGGRGGRIPVG